MTTITHVCTGYLIAQYAHALGFIPDASLPAITTVSILAANAPDFDVIAIKRLVNHRASLLHVPLFWLTAFGILGIIARFSHTPLLNQCIIISSINVFTHFLMDSISVGNGIRWLAPFSRKEYGVIFGQPATSPRGIVKNFFRYPLVVAESGLWLVTYFIRRGIWHI